MKLKILSENQSLRENSIDIEKWERDKKSIIIVDSLKKYFGDESLDSDYDSNKKLVDYAKAIGKSGVSILADACCFSL